MLGSRFVVNFFFSWTWLCSDPVLCFGLKQWFVSEPQPRACLNRICCSLFRLSQIVSAPKGVTLCLLKQLSLPMQSFIPNDLRKRHVKQFLLTGNSTQTEHGAQYLWTSAVFFKSLKYTCVNHSYTQETGKVHLTSKHQRRRGEGGKGWEEHPWPQGLGSYHWFGSNLSKSVGQFMHIPWEPKRITCMPLIQKSFTNFLSMLIDVAEYKWGE